MANRPGGELSTAIELEQSAIKIKCIGRVDNSPPGLFAI